MLICGASFAGLTVARELAGTGADVLVLDRDEIGAHPTSACAVPLPWLEALGLEGSIRQELPFMTFTTPHGSVRVRLPWSWAAFDYAELCRLLWEQCDARFERALVKGRVEGGVRTDRGTSCRRSSWTRSAGGACSGRSRSTARAARSHAGSRCIRTAPATRSTSHRPLARPARLQLAGPRRRRGARRRRLVRPTRRRQAADGRHGRAVRRPPGPPSGQPDPAPAPARGRGRHLLRRRLRRPLLRPLGRGDPRRVLLRDRLRPRAPPRLAGEATRRGGARGLRAPSARGTGARSSTPTRSSA